jgi:hypothetical protein
MLIVNVLLTFIFSVARTIANNAKIKILLKKPSSTAVSNIFISTGRPLSILYV